MAEGLPVTVVGAGVVGLSCALHLARAGACVRLIDAAGREPVDASSVAAGMLAPAAERLAEARAGDADRSEFQVLLHARDRWPAFAASVPGLDLHRSGTDLAAPASDRERMVGLLREGGIDFSLRDADRIIHLPQDWRIDVAAALQALRREADAAGVRRAAGRAGVDAEGRVRIDGELAPGPVVIAAGYGSAELAAAAPELAALLPIKGQILHLDGGVEPAPMRRSPAGYLVPQADGARAGGTMEPGLSDLRLDPPVAARLTALAVDLAPELASAPVSAHAGVRAATPDGRPLVGWSRTPEVLLATGARRNGWLLAPLIGEMIAASWGGADPGSCAPLFHPGRFGR